LEKISAYANAYEDGSDESKVKAWLKLLKNEEEKYLNAKKDGRISDEDLKTQINLNKPGTVSDELS